MIQTFNEFVLDWWQEYIGEATIETCNEIMQEWIGEEECLSNYISSDASDSREWLLEHVTDAEKIYRAYYGLDGGGTWEDMPDTNRFVKDLLMQANQYSEADFAEEFIENMACHIADYSRPRSFFADLVYGGCISGMVGMLIYNSDCKRIYIEHIDSMEDFKEELEGELGASITNRHKVPHYTFMCWLCYEELAFSIARNLWPDKF